MKGRTLILRTAVFSILAVVIYVAYKFEPSSYARAEEYELAMDEQEVIRKIQSFKKENPSYNVPQGVGLDDGRRGDDDLWYHVFFYYAEEQELVHAWVRRSGKNRTTVALVSVKDKLINKDFSEEDNARQKEKFKVRVVDKIAER
jgi:hypothetical protein